MNNTNQNLIEVLEQSGLAEDEKRKLMQAVNSMASDKILLAVTKALGDETAKELEERLDQNTAPEEIMNYLKEKLPNLKEIITEELDQTKLKVLAFLKEE